MKLAQLIDRSGVRLVRGRSDVTITGVADDSRGVEPGHLFVARCGSATDGARYIDDAARRGAAAVLADRDVQAPPSLAVLVGPNLSDTAASLATRFHHDPAARLRLLAVTGTNGKTTTTFMVRHLLARAGRRCGLIGTIEVDDGLHRTPASLTTPGRIELIGRFGRMVAHGCDSCVMETSSHALDQGRVDSLRFTAAAFTNLTGDHLDYHGTMERYAAAKARLFDSLNEDATAIINADDPAHRRMIERCRAKVLRFSMAGGGAELRAEVVAADPSGTMCRWMGPWGAITARLPLVGRHNVANMLGAIGLTQGAGGLPDDLAAAIESCPPTPGRLEPVAIEGRPLPFTVFVDYAHTDDALTHVLTSLRPITPGRLLVLFGCGGDRDATKRPRMAAVACRMADRIVVTSDNPRTEDPHRIIADILAGVGEADRPRVTVEADRAAAIERIIRLAEPGDAVLLAGKGHEDYQIIGTEKRPFDDRLIASAVLHGIV